jgi:transcriptional regulator with XRE-family HTH domain
MLKLALRLRGWDQRRLSEMLGVSPGHISRVIRGHDGASAKLLRAIVKAFEVDGRETLTILDLLGEDD